MVPMYSLCNCIILSVKVPIFAQSHTTNILGATKPPLQILYNRQEEHDLFIQIAVFLGSKQKCSVFKKKENLFMIMKPRAVVMPSPLLSLSIFHFSICRHSTHFFVLILPCCFLIMKLSWPRLMLVLDYAKCTALRNCSQQIWQVVCHGA